MRGKGIIAAAAAALGLTAVALVQPGLAGAATPGRVALAAAVGAIVGVAAALGLPRRGELAALGAAGAVRHALAGAAGLAAAPLLVMANRYTDAPSASEALFLTTAGWGAIAVAGGLLAGERRGWQVTCASAFTALVACAALVASWEFPSSFSPFVRFPREGAALLAAGVLWAAYSALVARAGAEARRAAAWTGAMAALGVALFTAVPGATAGLAAALPRLGAYAAASGLFVAGWLRVLPEDGLTRAAVVLFLPPVLVTGLSLAVASTAAGGQPMLLGRAGAAAALALASLTALAWRAPEATRSHGVARLARTAGAAVAGALAVAGLTADSVAASVAAHQGGGIPDYSAAWALAGWEVAGGWLAVAAAVWLAASAREPFRPVAVGTAVALAYPVLRAVPLHTWNTWLPAAVQQDFGTEYARLVFEPVFAPLQVAAVGVALAGLVAVGVASAYARRSAEEDGT